MDQRAFPGSKAKALKANQSRVATTAKAATAQPTTPKTTTPIQVRVHGDRPPAARVHDQRQTRQSLTIHAIMVTHDR